MHKAMLKRLIPIVVFILVWGGLIAGDWFFRFERFRWQDRFVLQAPSVSMVESPRFNGPEKPLSERILPEHRGGDLTRLAAARQVTEKFGELKPATRVVVDEYGYRNQPPTDKGHYPVMITGDSFMHVQYGDHGSFARQLAIRVPYAVYNHAYPGEGAFRGLRNYFASERFEGRRPDVVIWGLLEREISGVAFVGFVHQLNQINQRQLEQVPAWTGGYNWTILHPSKLARSLPDTSIISAGFNRLWNKIRYPVFKSIMPAVVLSLPDQYGQQQLFYRYTLDAMKWTTAQRDLNEVVRSIVTIQEHLRREGTELVILLIPDKPQVHLDQVPDVSVYPASTLYALEVSLRQHNVSVLNVLPVFLKARDNEIPTYWKDDTHWRPEGMEIAAEIASEWLSAYFQKRTAAIDQ